MITTAEKIGFWLRFTGIQLLYSLVILTGYFMFPLAFFLRHKLKVKKNPLWIYLNHTVDGDYGATWWLKREGITNPNFFTAYRWFSRNPCWNFILLFKPEWESGETDVFESVYCTFSNKWIWASRDNGMFGRNLCYYKVNGKTYGRLSYASKRLEYSLGTAGNRYKLIFKI